MTRKGKDALDEALGKVGKTMPSAGLCLQFTRQVFDVAPLYGTAIEAWNQSPTQHPDDRLPPPAVPVWFHTKSSARHVAFHVGDGVVISTFNEKIKSFASLSVMESTFDGDYIGWAEDINDVDVFDPMRLVQPLAVRREQIVVLIQDKDNGARGAFVLDDGTWDWVPSAKDMDSLESATGLHAALISNATFSGFTPVQRKRTND